MVRLHPHAKQRCRERGATPAEVIDTVLRGGCKPAKFGRMLFVHRFPFGKVWMGKHYATKKLEVIAVQRPGGRWLALTVIVKYY